MKLNKGINAFIFGGFKPKMILCVLAVLLLYGLPDAVSASEIPAEPWTPHAAYLPQEAPVNKREFRASWIATVTNLDFPSKASLSVKDPVQRAAQQKQELIKMLDECVAMKMNAVIFQVRPTSDSFYPSELAPWSFFLTDSLNGDPGFDPLAFAVEEAHKRGLELHAWFNPYRVSMYPGAYNLKTLDEVKAMLAKEPKSVYAKHPEWVKIAQNRLVLDPGIPEARQYVEDCVMEVVQKYDIDSVHFDDYFYVGETGVPGGDGIMDTDTYEKYNHGAYANIKDWRRGNTQKLVENLSKKIKAVKPWVKWGVSPAGVWRNIADDPALGSDTRAGLPNYDHAYADTRKWVLDNTIDYIMPQIYWSFGLSAAPYGEIADWWSETLKQNPQSKAHLYIGLGLYRLTEPGSDPYFQTVTGAGYRELERQMKYNLARPEISGSVLYRHANLSDPLGAPMSEIIKNNLWQAYALVPPMPQLGGIAPAAPSLSSVAAGPDGVSLTWTDQEISESEMQKTKYFAIYHTPSDVPMDTANPRNIIAIVPKTAGAAMTYTDKTHTGGNYCMTALNRLHDESAPSAVKSTATNGGYAPPPLIPYYPPELS